MNSWHEDFTQSLGIGETHHPNVAPMCFRDPKPTLMDYMGGLASRMGYAFWLPLAVAVGAGLLSALEWVLGRMVW